MLSNVTNPQNETRLISIHRGRMPKIPQWTSLKSQTSSPARVPGDQREYQSLHRYHKMPDHWNTKPQNDQGYNNRI